jgi:predicted metal-dependent hydrolase
MQSQIITRDKCYKGWFKLKGNVFNIGSLAIPYEVEYSSKCKPGRIKVVMDIDGMSVRVPVDYDIEDLHKILDKKSNWIYNSYNELKVMKKEKYLRNWESGERALYKGRKYNIRFYEFDVNDVLIKFDEKKFKVNMPKNCDKEIIRMSFRKYIFK